MFEFIQIGKILKPFRTDGEFIALIDDIFSSDLHKVKALFLKENGLEVPFFIEYIDFDNELYYIKLEEINNPEKVKKYNSSAIFLRKCDISNPGLIVTTSKNNSLVDFLILDKNTGKKYRIIKTEEYPQQLMAIVKEAGNDYLIPLVEEFIESIDKKKKEIKMNLPLNLIS